jgi:predicted RNA-binding protein YlqC (UPF0109 family)
MTEEVQVTGVQGDLEGLAKHLCQMVVKQPDAVEISVSSSERSLIISAKVAESDVGRVIGKQGGTIKAIRHLLEQAGRKTQSKIFFELANKEANRSLKQEKPESSSDVPGDSSESSSHVE